MYILISLTHTRLAVVGVNHERTADEPVLAGCWVYALTLGAVMVR